MLFKIETLLETVIFKSRWLMAPMYIGMVMVIVILVVTMTLVLNP